jgi:hypothetical protein
MTPESQNSPLLDNGSHLSAAADRLVRKSDRCYGINTSFVGTVKHRTIEELLEVVISTRFAWSYKRSRLGTSATFGLLYQPWIADNDDECGAVGGMRIDRGNRSSRRKPASVPLCPSQTSRARTRTTGVGSRRLTAWTMARSNLRPCFIVYILLCVTMWFRQPTKQIWNKPITLY